jgi:hypothetical protein
MSAQTRASACADLIIALHGISHARSALALGRDAAIRPVRPISPSAAEYPDNMPRPR